MNLPKLQKTWNTYTVFHIIAFYLWIFIWQYNKRILQVGADLFQLVGTVVTFYLLLVVYKKSKFPEKKFWLYLALGVLCEIIAYLYWDYYEIILKVVPPFAGISDFFWIMFNCFYLAGIFYKMYKNNNLCKALGSIFETMIIMSVVVTFSWKYIINPILQQCQNQSWVYLLIYLGSPISNLGILIGVLLIYLTLDKAFSNKVFLLLFSAFFLLFIANLIYTYIIMTGTYSTGSVVDPLWSLSLLLVALAGLYSLNESKQYKGLKLSIIEYEKPLNIFIEYITVFTLVIVNFIYNELVFLVGLSVTILLILMKQIIVITENKKLLQTVTTLNLELENKIKERTKELNESNQRLKSLFRQNSSAVYSLDLYGNITSVNSTCEQLLGQSEKELVGRSIVAVVNVDKETIKKIKSYFNKTIEGIAQNFEISVITKDRLRSEFDISFTPIIVEDEVIGIYGIMKDITEKKKDQKKIQHMAYHDELTSLPNRRFLLDNMERIILDKSHSSVMMALMFIDLDRFKGINDRLGHEMGDKLLIAVTRRLTACLRKSDIVARQGGDEFIVLLTDISSVENVKVVAEKILAALNESFFIEGNELMISCSIGIALYPHDGNNSMVLMKNADLAMYRVKETGKNGYEFYTIDIDKNCLIKVYYGKRS